jgi:hypothetical protein
VCTRLGIHVILFRGAERNRRRGFHNLYVFYRQLSHEDRSSPTGGPRTRQTLTTIG